MIPQFLDLFVRSPAFSSNFHRRRSRERVVRNLYSKTIPAIVFLHAGLSCLGACSTKGRTRGNDAAQGSAAPVPSGNDRTLPSSNEVQTSQINAALGTSAFDSLVASREAEAATLRIIPVERAERQIFKGPDFIAGYPVTTHLSPVPSAEVSRIIALLVRDENYDFNGRLRCKNRSLLGIRFLGTQTVELAIGIPCNQAIWAVNRKWVGMGLSAQAVSSINGIVTALSNSGP
jgi:hypothetical protein